MKYTSFFLKKILFIYPISFLLICGGSFGGDPKKYIRILTWNIHASSVWENILYEFYFTPPAVRRFNLLLDVVKDTNPDIIALQEVGKIIIDSIKKDSFFNHYYTSSNLDSDSPGGLLVLSRFPIESSKLYKLASPSGRKFLLVQIRINGYFINFGTLHLESPIEDSAVRINQLKEISFRLDETYAILAGDFNFNDGDKEEKYSLFNRFIDPWKTLRPNETGYTYDIDRNILAKENAYPNEKSRRLDRILLSSKYSVEDVGLVKQDLINTGWPPSDHEGLFVDIKWPPEGDN